MAKSIIMKRISYFPFTLVLLLSSGAIDSSAFAQQSNSNEKSKENIDSTLLSEHLVSLKGKPGTFYSVGFDIRANTLHKLFHDCINYYEGIFPEKKFATQVYILNKKDWEIPNFEEPYGMPFYDPDYDILVIAAEKDALAKLSGLKDATKTSDSVLTGLDYQPLHELGHYFFFTLYKINKEKWFNEFLATYFLICYLKERNLEPNLEDELNADYPVEHRTLEDFQKFYLQVGPQNYHWYQSKFAKLGFKLYPKFNTNLIKEVLNNYNSAGKALDGISLLRDLAPETLNEWLKEMR
jgi:hypothetical protein